MAKEQKDITTLDVQIAEFIRSHSLEATLLRSMTQYGCT